MNDNEIQMLIDSSDRLVSSTSLDFKRYLYPKIDWSERLICIKGPKGTGKTTLILQHVKETFGAGSGKAVYIALDHIWFSNHQPIDAIEHFHSHGYTHVFIDEVHCYGDWSSLVKTAADFYPGLNIAYSGSSILKLSKEIGSGVIDDVREKVDALKAPRNMSVRTALLYDGKLSTAVEAEKYFDFVLDAKSLLCDDGAR